MSGLDDFIKGAEIFNQGLQQLAIGSAVKRSNERMTEANMLLADENERFQAAQQSAQLLTNDMLQAGASPQQISAATDKFTVSAGAQFQARENEKLQGKTQEFQADESAKERALRRELAMLQHQASLAKGSKEGQLSSGELEKIQEQDSLVQSGQHLLRHFNDLSSRRKLPIVGPGRGGFVPFGESLRKFGDPELVAFSKDLSQFSLAYKKLITGTQSSEEERALLKQAIPDEDDREPAFRKSLQTYNHVQENIKMRRLENMAKANRDVSSFVTPELRALTKLPPGSEERVMLEAAIANPNDPAAINLMMTHGLMPKGMQFMNKGN